MTALTQLKTGERGSESGYDEHHKTHCGCIVCGDKNPISLGLEFRMHEDGKTSAVFRPGALFQGYTGMVHGGIIATLLDSTMTHCLFHKNVRAVTGELKVRYLKPVEYGNELTVTAWLDSSYAMLYIMKSEITCGKRLLARGEGKFMRV